MLFETRKRFFMWKQEHIHADVGGREELSTSRFISLCKLTKKITGKREENSTNEEYRFQKYKVRFPFQEQIACVLNSPLHIIIAIVLHISQKYVNFQTSYYKLVTSAYRIF